MNGSFTACLIQRKKQTVLYLDTPCGHCVRIETSGYLVMYTFTCAHLRIVTMSAHISVLCVRACVETTWTVLARGCVGGT